MNLRAWLDCFASRCIGSLRQHRARRRRDSLPNMEVLESRVVPAVMNLSAIADAHVRGGSSYLNTNYGTGPTLNVRNHATATSDYESFLRFDLATVSGTIQNATLKLTPSSHGNDIKTYGFRVRLLQDSDDNWVEGNGGTNNNPVNEIRWGNKPTGTGLSLNVVPTTIANNQAYSIDVTSMLAQSIHANKLASFHLDVTGESTSRYVYFHSKEATNAAYRPVLVITTADGTNSAPVAVNDAATTNEDTAATISVRSNDSDANGDPLTITAVTQGAKGSVVINAGSTVTYTPSANVNGTDSFTYTISDGKGGTATATVNMTINAINDAPVAVNDAATTNEDTSVTVSVRANDTDVEGQTLIVSTVTQGAKGKVTINAGSTVTYAPNANVNGTDSFTYTVSDGSGGTSTATVNVTINAVNDAPVAVADSASTAENTATTISVLSNDSDVEDTALSVSAVTTPTNGTAIINANGTISYTPASGYVGPDSFTYTANDGALTSSAVVSITVTATSAGVWPYRAAAPYIDFTAWPPFDFNAMATNYGVTYFNLGFVVADASNQPSWGTYYTTASAYRLADIQTLRANGGDVMVSFGGAANNELATVITDVTALTNAYQSVINTYDLHAIDFDIEGAAIANTAANTRRSQAIRNLQLNAAASSRQLDIWLTLPVLPTGLTSQGIAVVASAIDAGVNLSGVNVMAMDYGGSTSTNMGQAAIQAGTSTFNQLKSLYQSKGIAKTDAQLWHMVGVTPMIGVNDTGEKFYTSDATELLTWAQQQDIGMLAYWSANRDKQGTLNVLSGSSSGVPQTDYQFGTIFDPFTQLIATPASPTLSISDATVTEGNPTSGGVTYLQTSGSQIVDANGNNVKIAGVNWFGMETSNFAPHGLWTRGYKSMMDQMKQQGFNTIRLPYSNQLFDAGSTPNGIDFSQNADLQGLSGLQIMDKIVAYAGQIGLRIMLDHHRSDAGAGPNGNGLWYIDANNNGNINDDPFGEQRFINDWVMLATRYANNPTVIGADLHNEPHAAATWGSGSATTDWRLAAQRAGNAILAANPNWLIVVEGIESYSGQNYWWGGNLAGAGANPVTLNTANRVVYSPHDYPASVYPQSWFSAANYPNNLPAVWDATWGYLFKNNVAPVLLGEFGSKLATTSDQQWYDSITKYLGGDFDLNGTNDLSAGQQGLSWTYWCWNPNSGDTGGILADDWQTVQTAKVTKLTPIEFTFPTIGGTTTTPLTFTVTLSPAATVPVTVNYATSSGTATSGTDFTAASGSLTFAAGETSKTITVNVTRDTTSEANETFNITLSSASGAIIGDGAGIGTITDDDTAPPPPLPTLSINDVAVTEGNSGTKTATFTVTLSSASSSSVTVNYATGTTSTNAATSGTDFVAASGSLTFAAGETTKTIAVTINGDTTSEPTETFAINLTTPSGATLADSQGIGTITNDDSEPVGGATVAFRIDTDWGTAFQGALTIQNNNATPIVNWRLEFDWDRNIYQIWDAVIVSKVGTHYIIEGAAYNRDIAANSPLSFGFLADPGNVVNGPQNFILNGAPL